MILKFFTAERQKKILEISEQNLYAEVQTLIDDNLGLHYYKPLLIRSAILSIYKKRRGNNFSYFIYKYFYPINLFRILWSYKLFLPDFNAIGKNKYFLFSKGVNRAKVPIASAVDLDVITKKVYPVTYIIKVIIMAYKSGLWDPYYHINYILMKKELKKLALKNKVFLWEDGGDVSSQIIKSLNEYYGKVIGLHSTPGSILKSNHNVYTNNKYTYQILKKINQKCRFIKYQNTIFGNDQYYYFQRNDYEIGIISPLSTDNTRLYQDYLNLTYTLSRVYRVLVSYHPQESKQIHFGNVFFRKKTEISDKMFCSICTYYICPISSLLVLLDSLKRNIIFFDNISEKKYHGYNNNKFEEIIKQIKLGLKDD